MVKTYLRYKLAKEFGSIYAEANLQYDSENKFLICGSLESILVWNVKLGEIVSILNT